MLYDAIRCYTMKPDEIRRFTLIDVVHMYNDATVRVIFFVSGPKTRPYDKVWYDNVRLHAMIGSGLPSMIHDHRRRCTKPNEIRGLR